MFDETPPGPINFTLYVQILRDFGVKKLVSIVDKAAWAAYNFNNNTFWKESY